MVRFYRGEIYRRDERAVLVVELLEDGRKATLRPFDGSADFTALWTEFCLTEGWKRFEEEATS